MSHPIKSALLFVSILMLVTDHPVNGLKENEEVTDDFDTGAADFWQWIPGAAEENSTTVWHLSKHGDPPPFGIDAVRPPMEDNGGGYLEIVPFSDSPAQILSNVFDLLPYATVEMTYWNVVPIPVQGRNTVLILYLEFQNVTLNDETDIEPPLRTVMVFKAPTPTDPSPGWTTVTVDLPITEPCQVQLRIDGTRTDLPTTGLAVSKITVKNGVDVSTTTSTTMSSTTTRAQSPSTESVTTPTRYAVDKSTSTTSTTTPTTTSTSAPGATPPTSTTLDSSTVTSAASTEESTVSDLPTETFSSDSPSSSTSTSSTSSPTSTVTTSISPPQMTSSSLSSITSTTTNLPTSSSLSSLITSTSTIVTTASTIGINITTTTIDLPTATSSTPKLTTTSSTTTSSAFSTRPTTSASMSSTDFTDPPTLTPPSGMTTNQLRDVLIGVGVAILLFFLFCLLFTICYRRHRRRAYLIENRQLENGIIRSLELTDQFPYTIHKNESDSSSISSTTASDCPLAPKPPGQTSVKDLLPNFLRSLSSTSSKITKLT
ncbi:mucin-5AC-like isoform X1 [Daphnia pulex]|uniref:mucin-5AC-like isoform X1 n=2 Tax=Daphnia pulex TaxID=6669 RepID=UPI001EDDC468|nr:mucin-5AC-like isoform X1 [Daphnia pulex]